MESRWAAIDLLELIEEELYSTREPPMPSREALDASRVLPGSVAGDMFVNSAARGQLGDIVSYFKKGKSARRADARGIETDGNNVG